MSILHADTTNKQGGEWHLTQAQRDNIQALDEATLYDMVEDKLPKLYAWGQNTRNWPGAEYVNAATPRELTLPVKSKPIKLASANIYTHLVKFANRETYGYRITEGYFLDKSNSISFTDMPVKCEGLGDWADVKMPRYWTEHRPNGSVVSSILTDTSKHLEFPISANSDIKTLEYNERGDGFIATLDGVAAPLTYTISSGAKIKKMVLDVTASSGASSSIKCIIYAEDGVYFQNSGDALAPTKISFPENLIKNVCIANSTTFFIQSTEGNVYLSNYPDILSSPSYFAGDIKTIPFVAGMNRYYLLANDGKLYYCGNADTAHDLPLSGEVFTHIKPDYRFEDIVANGSSCLAIGRKIA